MYVLKLCSHCSISAFLWKSAVENPTHWVCMRKRFLKMDNFGYLFSQYFIKGKWEEERHHHSFTQLVSHSPWARACSCSISWGEDSLSSERSGSKPMCCQHSFSGVLSQANSWQYREVLKDSCIKYNKCLKHRNWKIILTLMWGKICISSHLSPVFSPVPVIHFIVGEKTPLWYAAVTARLGFDSEYFRLHTVQIIENEHHASSHSSPLTHQQLTSDITSTGD